MCIIHLECAYAKIKRDHKSFRLEGKSSKTDECQIFKFESQSQLNDLAYSFEKSLMIKKLFKDILKSAINYFYSVTKVIIKQGSFLDFSSFR